MAQLIHDFTHFYESPLNTYIGILRYSKSSSSGWFGDLVMLAIVGGVVYAIYVTCISSGNNNARPGAERGNPPPYNPHDHGTGPRGSPPPYGFGDAYIPKDHG